MRLHIRAAILLSLSMTMAVRANAWPSVSYSEVRAFSYNSKGEPDRPIIHYGRLDKSVINKRGTLLTAAQAKQLLAAVSGNHPDPKVYTLCFNPRHAFVFYDSTHRAVAWIEVCFECNNVHTTPSQDRQFPDMGALARLRDELNLPKHAD